MWGSNQMGVFLKRILNGKTDGRRKGQTRGPSEGPLVYNCGKTVASIPLLNAVKYVHYER